MKRVGAPDGLSRRALLSSAVGVGGLAWAGGALAGVAGVTGDPPADDRLAHAYTVRIAAAKRARSRGATVHRTNGDEEALPRSIACYSKGLPHDPRGEVDPKAYEILKRALRTGEPRDFESIPLGGFVKLANPQAAWAFDLVGPDASQSALAPPPGFAGPEQAAELVELYWQALARDVPFTEYGSHPIARQAAEELSRLSGYRGPRSDGRVTPETLFRGVLPGDGAGPYISQFLWKDVPFTPLRIEQRIRTAVPGLDYLTDIESFRANQNGALAGVNRFDGTPRFLRNGRDLGEYVHRDFSYQPYLDACLMALKIGTPPDGANPYKHSRTQSAFATFGQPYLLYLLAVVTQSALAACWFQKWCVHRRLRPEELGGRVETHLTAGAAYPLHGDLLGSAALAEVRRRYGQGLLPQAYPEGCPTHPSYPAGHAVIAGACVTALKACFDESYAIPQPMEAQPDGLALVPWRGPQLSVGGELDKLASNIALGRNFAGVHWRSDATEGLRLGEAVAITILQEMKLTGNELFSGFSLRRFDGTRAVI